MEETVKSFQKHEFPDHAIPASMCPALRNHAESQIVESNRITLFKDFRVCQAIIGHMGMDGTLQPGPSRLAPEPPQIVS